MSACATPAARMADRALPEMLTVAAGPMPCEDWLAGAAPTVLTVPTDEVVPGAEAPLDFEPEAFAVNEETFIWCLQLFLSFPQLFLSFSRVCSASLATERRGWEYLERVCPLSCLRIMSVVMSLGSV